MNEKTGQKVECPLLDSAREVEDSAQGLAKAMRRFRRNMRVCEKCVSKEDCPILKDINHQIDLAIQDVVEALGLV